MRKVSKKISAAKAKRAASQADKHTVTEEKIAKDIRGILAFIGDNPDREGLIETPRRMIKSWDRLFGGYKQDPAKILKTFTEGSCDEMVVLKDIEFYSTCEHHFAPFMGTISIGYLPKGKILGISKLARLVEVFARRLQIQEKLSAEIADTLMKHLSPHGVMVVCKAKHMCICSRGVEKHNAVMVTSAIRGAFKKPEVRAEFLDFIK
ncbi:GTP cyclohydrolase I [Parelusimicrobium proximum]|uniref:GTP cyclohydrolase I FolE n=1 Tax=Parelusimicrobium proximum TaxID=3228953 RepID=UPI003D17336E